MLQSQGLLWVGVQFSHIALTSKKGYKKKKKTLYSQKTNRK